MRERYQITKRGITGKIHQKIKSKVYKEDNSHDDVYIQCNEILPKFHCSCMITNKTYTISTKSEILKTNEGNIKKLDYLKGVGEKLPNVEYNKYKGELSQKGEPKYVSGLRFSYKGGYLGEYFRVVKVEFDLGHYVICSVNSEDNFVLYTHNELERMKQINN